MIFILQTFLLIFSLYKLLHYKSFLYYLDNFDIFQCQFIPVQRDMAEDLIILKHLLSS
jgi:hypothetical protein